MTTRPSRNRDETEVTNLAEMVWVKPVLCVLIVAIFSFLFLNPTVKSNAAQTFGVSNQNEMFDTVRQIKRVYIDSFMPLFQRVQAQVGCQTVVDTNPKLRIFVEDKTCDRSFNTIYTGNIALSEYFKMKNSPIKAVSTGYGFETPIEVTEKGRIVALPIDILKSVVEAFHANENQTRPALAPKTGVAKPKMKKK